MKVSTVYKDMDLTYGELAKALEKLKFENRSNKQYFIYYNREFDASVLLPLKRRNAKVEKAHFAAFSWGLEQQGVLEHEYDLGKMIEQSRLKQLEAAA